MIHDNTPIIIGAGVASFHEKDPARAPSPIDALTAAGAKALADAGFAHDDAAIDAVSSLRFVVDSPESSSIPLGHYNNPAYNVARALGLKPAHYFLTATGGNSPQYTVSAMAEKIATGEIKAALIVGGEALDSITRNLRAGIVPKGWNDMQAPAPQEIGSERAGVNATESAHSLQFPVNVYPLFETALRHKLGRTHEQHAHALGELMSRFSQVAAQHSESWFPVARSPQEIMQAGVHNRWVGFPYPKYMNAVIRVNQAAGLVLTSVGEARARGIAPANWVYLHGCAELNDIWHVVERPELHRSHAIQSMTKLALDMAGWSLDDLNYFDIYSCFPVAVEVACREMGLAEDDSRGLTITGGLPYFGGAGNAYALLSLAMMQSKLRANPGSCGMCTGNGWFLTKHSIGLYSTTPFAGEWARPDLAKAQAKIDDLPVCEVEAHPQGEGVIESYTIAHPSGKPRFGLVIGRLSDGKTRFVAQIPDESDWLDTIMRAEGVGLKGTLTPQDDGVNIFTPLG